MIDTLLPISGQLEETYDAVLISIHHAGSESLGWRPAPHLRTFAEVVEHIASSNLLYATMIGPTDVTRKWDNDPSPSLEWLLDRFNESLITVVEVISAVTEDNLHESRCGDWNPNCEEQTIVGPLDALWFTLQMARHTAYHLGQLNLYLRLMNEE